MCNRKSGALFLRLLAGLMLVVMPVVWMQPAHAFAPAASAAEDCCAETHDVTAARTGNAGIPGVTDVTGVADVTAACSASGIHGPDMAPPGAPVSDSLPGTSVPAAPVSDNPCADRDCSPEQCLSVFPSAILPSEITAAAVTPVTRLAPEHDRSLVASTADPLFHPPIFRPLISRPG
jgi:hypothetical protein